MRVNPSKLQPRAPDFYAEPALPGSHYVQFYSDLSEFNRNLLAWVAGGLLAGEPAVVIATQAHRAALLSGLEARLVETTALQVESRLVLLDAQHMLDRFMVAGHPDPTRFDAVIEALVEQASVNGVPVRAFGEMVVLLWESGHSEAALELEALWQDACGRLPLSLLCAYPKHLFQDDDAEAAIKSVCCAHTSVIVT